MSDPKSIIDEFCTICEQVWMEHAFYASLIEADQRNSYLCFSIAPLFFEHLNQVVCEHLTIQFTKITDPAKTGKSFNLTPNYLVEELSWPATVADELRQINGRLMAFRSLIESARNKRIVHQDLEAQTQKFRPLGEFPEGDDKKFLEDLQKFVNIVHGHYNNGELHPIDVARSTDTCSLFRALGTSKIFDQCARCDAHDRTAAILDYEAGVH